MANRSAPPEGAFSGTERTDSAHREVQIIHNYHGTVNKVEYAENANFGDNHGTLNQVSDRSHAIAGNQQHVEPIDPTNLIELLRPILDASHTRNRETSPPNSACFPGTRTDVIRVIVAWVDSTLLRNTHVLWLYGFVGCGKS
ncbi:hypothetical protein EST38_g11845, partial [Candolleomyces aberdarensis]